MKAKLPCLLLLGLVASAWAAQFDADGLGRDLNGWQHGKGRFQAAGTVFEATRPVSRTESGGGLRVALELRESRRGGSSAYESLVEVLVTPGGRIASLRVHGTVEGRNFDSGTVTRPDPVAVVEGTDGAEGSERETPAMDPDREMRQDLADRLARALAEARASEEVVKRDLSAWVFGSRASADTELVAGTMEVVRAMARHSGS